MHLYEGTSCLLPHFTVMEQFHQLRTDLDAQERRTCPLPPGRLRLATNPICTGSAIVVKTMGIALVAAFAARTAGVVVAAITAHLPTDQIGCHRRQSIVLNLRPPVLDLGVLAAFVTCLPQPFNKRVNEPRLTVWIARGEIPITGIAIRCARAPIGQAAAPPPSALMKSLRLIAPSLRTEPYPLRPGHWKGTASSLRKRGLCKGQACHQSRSTFAHNIFDAAIGNEPDQSDQSVDEERNPGATKASAIAAAYSSGEILPFRSAPRAVASTECVPCFRMIAF